jgi:midasin
MAVDGGDDKNNNNNNDETSAASFLRRAAVLGPEAWGGAAPAAGRFEWVDGVLLKAAVKGEWVLLENANLCSPTVLDRLNPLLEIGGSLLVSECGMRNGEPRVITAHPVGLYKLNPVDP